MGRNNFGELGRDVRDGALNPYGNQHGQPARMKDPIMAPHEIDAAHFGGAPVVAVSCGFDHMLALTGEGKAFACGRNFRGNDAEPTGVATPQRVMGVLKDLRVVRITAAHDTSFALTDDGGVFEFRPNTGDAQDLPRLLQGALEDITVRALTVGYNAGTSIFIAGTPPAEPGFDGPVYSVQYLAWLRRRPLLLCLLRSALSEPRAEGAPPPAQASAAGDDVLLRMAALPEELWKGPCFFQFL
jgi:hypothetical protein